MASKVLVFFIVQGLTIQTILGQCINRVPNGQSLNQILQALAPQSIIQQHPNIIQQHPNIIHQHPNIIQQHPNIIQQHPNIIQQHPQIFQQLQHPQLIQQQHLIGENVVSPCNAAIQNGGVPAILHDNTVSNNLAHALQLLVVSNLLSNTLPGSACEESPAKYVQPAPQYAPPPPPPCPCNGGPFVNVY